MRAKEVSAGVESSITIPGDASGNIAWGTAGAANANVMTVQGIASGVAQPISGSVTVASGSITASGTVTANAGTNLNTSLLALETGGNLASTKTNTDRLLSSATNIVAGSALATTSFVVGTRYLSAPPTFSNGQEGALQIDANGKLLVAGSFSASPPTNSYTHIATSTTTNAIKSGAGTLSRIVVNQTGTVASLISVFDNTTATGTTIAIIDGLTRTGNYDYELAFATGLSIITTGTAAPDITVVWR